MMRLLILCALCAWTGCESGFIKPETSMSAGPGGSLFKYNSSKDVMVEADGVDVDPETKHVKMDRFRLSSMASPVITSNVAQMAQLGQNYLLLGQAWANYTDSVNRLGTSWLQQLPNLKQFAPAVGLNGPFGLSASIPPEAVQVIADAVLKKISEAKAVPASPVNP